MKTITEQTTAFEATRQAKSAPMSELMTKAVKAAARPVTGDTVAHAAASRGGVISVRDALPPGIEFARYAMCLAAAKGSTPQALEIARARYPAQGRIATVLKAAVNAGTTTDPTWAGALVEYQQFSGDFIEFLRPLGVLLQATKRGLVDLEAASRIFRTPTSVAAVE